ncbi:nucleotide-binding protein [Octadecabacter sp.]|nr:nucleotide-binding protein [Octadecabacter sp.]
MVKKKKRFRVFYSWQSDLPKKTNLNAIRNAIALACKKLSEASAVLKLVPDEATRDTSGSPNIPLKILEKIEKADFFVADVTTITPSTASRPCPNPNVTFELGYAVAILGWDRVILLFNQSIGTFPADLPFDFVQNRASPYQFVGDSQKADQEQLNKFLQVAIKAVLIKNPKRPAELKSLSPEKVKHTRDVENMTWLMDAIHLPTLQSHIDEMPRMITDKAIWFWENFHGVVGNSLFNVYDPILQQAVDKLYSGWRGALNHVDEYNSTPGNKVHVFSSPGDMPLVGARQTAWDEIDAGRRDMAAGLTAILDRLRADYIEIDIHASNAKAWRDYVGFQKDAKKLWSKSSKPKKKNK